MDYLRSTYCFDFENPVIQDIIHEMKQPNFSAKEKAMKIYLKIRDGWRYNPYHISIDKESYKASTIAKREDAHCLEKAILLIACLRGLGIPARLHLVKVKNHIGIERLLEKFGTNEMSPHGMVDICLNDKWLKVSPAFNAELCEWYNVPPLDFDGENDSVFQQYDKEGNIFMEYVEDYGHFEDVPAEFIFNNFRENYPEIFEKLLKSGNITI